MSNYIYNCVQVTGAGKTFNSFVQKQGSNVNIRDIRIVDDNTVEFESRSDTPLYEIVLFSKECKGELILTYNDEGRYIYESQYKIKNGEILGFRERYNDGEEAEEYPDWTLARKYKCVYGLDYGAVVTVIGEPYNISRKGDKAVRVLSNSGETGEIEVEELDYSIYWEEIKR